MEIRLNTKTKETSKRKRRTKILIPLKEDIGKGDWALKQKKILKKKYENADHFKIEGREIEHWKKINTWNKRRSKILIPWKLKHKKVRLNTKTKATPIKRKYKKVKLSTETKGNLKKTKGKRKYWSL